MLYEIHIIWVYCQYVSPVDFEMKSTILRRGCQMHVSVNYHQFILASNNVLFLNIANITLISLWAVARTAFL